MIRRIEGFEGFAGYVEIDFGKYRQRMIDISALSINIGEDGLVNMKDTSAIKEIMKMYDMVHTKVKTVDLLHIASQKRISSMDELEDFQEYTPVMNRLIELFNKGESLGNS